MIQFIIKHSLLLLLLIFIIYCDNNSTNNTDTFPNFDLSPEEKAVIESGFKNQPAGIVDPYVINDSDGYHLFYTCTFVVAENEYNYSADHTDTKLLLEAIQHPFKTTMAYAFSNDKGMTWQFRKTPIVTIDDNALQDWQSGKLETAAVAKVNNKLYLFYCAYTEDFNSRYQIGGAVLDLNGKSISEQLLNESNTFDMISNPILPYNTTNANAFNNNTQEPSVVIKDNKLELFYIGIGLGLPDQPYNAENQTVDSIALYKAVLDFDLNILDQSSTPVIPFANITQVLYFDNRYHVFSTTTPEGIDNFHEREYITYYKSNDSNGTEWDPPIIIIKPNYGKEVYNGWGAMAPTVVKDNNTLVLFYTAFGIESRENSSRVMANTELVENKNIYTTMARAVSKLK